MGILFANNASSSLAAGIAAGDTSLTLVDGSAFPSPVTAAGDYFFLTLANADETAWEVVKVTARSGNVCTVERGQDGTTAASWGTGTKAEARLCNAAMIAVAQGHGIAAGNWQAYTPVWTSLSNPQPAIGNGNISARWRRVGDSLEVLLTLTAGSTSSFGTDEWYFSLPPGLTLGSAAGPLGTAMAYDSSAAQAYFGSVLAQGTDRVRILTGLNWRSSHPMAWASGDYIFLRFTAQILEWGTNINLAQDFTEYVSCDGTESGAGTAASTVYTPATVNRSPDGSLFPAVAISSATATTVTSYDLAFLNDIKDSDLLFLEVNVGRGWTPLISGIGSLAPYSIANGVHAGIMIDRSVAGTKIVRVRFSNAGTRPGATYGTGQNTWTDVRNAAGPYKWRIRKVSNGNFAEAGSDSYSTAETLTNKTWVDGKPIYRKVVNCGALPNNATKTVAHGLPSPRTIVSISGFSAGLPLPSPSTTSLGESVQMWIDGTNINIRTGSDRSAHTPSWVTIEYTKG